jgi:hypothetical protein
LNLSLDVKWNEELILNGGYVIWKIINFY